MGISTDATTRTELSTPVHMPAVWAADAPAPSDGSTDPAVTFRLVASTPAIPENEVENIGVTAIEIMILWDETVMHVAHLTPARSFFVGEENSDFHLPIERIGASRIPLVLVRESSVVAVIPPGARGSIDVLGIGQVTLEEARQRQLLVACGDFPGAGEIAISGRIRIELNGFVFQIATVNAGKKIRATNRDKRASVAFWLASAALHTGLVTALMMSPGDSLDNENALPDKPTQAYMMSLSTNAATHEISVAEKVEAGAKEQDGNHGGSGGRHLGSEGMSGSPDKNNVNARYSIAGPSENRQERMARLRTLIESNNYGAISALASVFGTTKNTPIDFNSDSDLSNGHELENYNGHLAGDHYGNSFGYNGLGLTGSGPGGGGFDPNGIGLGPFGGFGHGCCGGDGDLYGTTIGTTVKSRTRKSGPVLHPIEGGADIVGKIPPESIRRIVRANFGRFRMCYEQGLKKDPGIRGTISVRFIIDNVGAVESASLSGGTMSDSQVKSCVLGVYQTLSFPEPEGGKVMVNYPIDFQNDE